MQGISAQKARAEKRPQQRGVRRLAVTAHSNRQQRGNKRPTVSQITATRSIVPNKFGVLQLAASYIS